MCRPPSFYSTISCMLRSKSHFRKVQINQFNRLVADSSIAFSVTKDGSDITGLPQTKLFSTIRNYSLERYKAF